MDKNDDKSHSFEEKIDTNGNLIRERVYLSPNVDRAIRRISEENKISRSAVIRILLASHLSEYLSSIYYVDTTQGMRIQESLSEVIGLLCELNYQVKKIGVNLNQVAKVLNKKSKTGIQNGYEYDNISQSPGLEGMYSDNDLRELRLMVSDLDNVIYRLGGELWPIFSSVH